MFKKNKTPIEKYPSASSSFLGRYKEKTKAQALVEFALVLPILLLVIYGVLEAGRLLFIFASVNTASRQAVRYGSAIGLVDVGGGTLRPHYEDCNGITSAANNVAFIAPFTNVNIAYDRGLDPGDGSPVPISGVESDPAVSNACPSVTTGTIRDGDRVNVYVSARFAPIIPFVPLDPLTIESSASRTIVGDISIHVTALPEGWDPASGTALAISLQKTASPDTYTAAGQTITYTFTIANEGSFDVGPFTINDPQLGLPFSCGAASLAPDDLPTSCTKTYITQAVDVTNGSITNTATATANGADPVEDTEIVTFVPSPSLKLLSVTASPTEAFTVGAPIIYTYTFQNTGNVDLGAFEVHDNVADSTNCAGATDPLQPGDTTACTGSYAITAADLSHGDVINTAYISEPAYSVDSNALSAFVLTTKLLLREISVSPSSVSAAGQVVTFTYTLENRGSVDISRIDSLTGTNVQNVTCNGGNPLPYNYTLAHGETVTCTSTYPVTQADMDAGTSVTLNATATATASGDTLTSNPRSASVTLYQVPGLQLVLSATPNEIPLPPNPDIVDPNYDYTYPVDYSFTLQNTGNVTLRDFTFTVPGLIGNPTPTCADTTPLAPGAERECVLNYVISEEERLESAMIEITDATARAAYGPTDPAPTTQSNPVSHSLITWPAPRITLTLTAPETAVSGDNVTFTFLVRNTGNTDLSPFEYHRVDTTGPALNLNQCLLEALAIGESAQLCLVTKIVSEGVTTAIWEVTAPEAAVPSQDSATVTVTAPAGCDPRHGALKTAPFSFTIFNNHPTLTLTISNIQIFWNNSGGNGIDTIMLGGTEVWNGNENSTPASFSTFSGPVTIPPLGDRYLQFNFKKAYVPFDPKQEKILVTFAEAGCPILDTDNDGQSK